MSSACFYVKHQNEYWRETAILQGTGWRSELDVAIPVVVRESSHHQMARTIADLARSEEIQACLFTVYKSLFAEMGLHL